MYTVYLNMYILFIERNVWLTMGVEVPTTPKVDLGMFGVKNNKAGRGQF